MLGFFRNFFRMGWRIHRWKGKALCSSLGFLGSILEAAMMVRCFGFMGVIFLERDWRSFLAKVWLTRVQ
jgi:hypothetical protein